MTEPRNAGLCTHTHTALDNTHQRHSAGVVLGRSGRGTGDGEAPGIYEVAPMARPRLYKIAHRPKNGREQTTAGED